MTNLEKYKNEIKGFFTCYNMDFDGTELGRTYFVKDKEFENYDDLIEWLLSESEESTIDEPENPYLEEVFKPLSEVEE